MCTLRIPLWFQRICASYSCCTFDLFTPKSRFIPVTNYLKYLKYNNGSVLQIMDLIGTDFTLYKANIIGENGWNISYLFDITQNTQKPDPKHTLEPSFGSKTILRANPVVDFRIISWYHYPDVQDYTDPFLLMPRKDKVKTNV